VTITWDRQLQRPFGSHNRLGATAIAVVGNTGFSFLREVYVHLGIEHALGHRLLQIGN
jgi:hypothetical protein